MRPLFRLPSKKYELLRHIFPPDGFNLSDAWVVKIVQSDLRKEDRYKRWPAVFSSRSLKTSYQNKGTPSKHQDSAKKWRYDLLSGNFEMHFEMHGEEGRNAGMIFDYGKKTTMKTEIRDGQLCVSQNAAATSAGEAATPTPGTTEGSPAAADTSQATALAPTTIINLDRPPLPQTISTRLPRPYRGQQFSRPDHPRQTRRSNHLSGNHTLAANYHLYSFHRHSRTGA